MSRSGGLSVGLSVGWSSKNNKKITKLYKTLQNITKRYKTLQIIEIRSPPLPPPLSVIKTVKGATAKC